MTKELNELAALGIIRDAYDKLMSRQFFYYNIASQFALKAVLDVRKVKTMGVAHVDSVHWLIYNPKFICFYDYKEMSAILEHEIRHFTDDHVKHFDPQTSARPIFRTEGEAAEHVRTQEEKKLKHKLENIAQDRAINVQLYGLPKIRFDIADLKDECRNDAGELDREAYLKHIARNFSKEKIAFKSITVNTDPKPFVNAEGELDELNYALYLESALDGLPQDTVLESDNINEESFKKILVEGGYPGDINQVQKYGTWEYYFQLLMSCPKNEQAVQDIRNMDVHFGSEDGDGEGGRQAQEARDRLLIEAARNSNKHDIPGNLRDQIRALIDKYSKEDALPWNIILRRMVNASKKSIKKNDVNSRNKYAPGEQILPGYRLDPIKDVAVIWDVSGSCMDDETQGTFIKEVNMMIKSGSAVRCYYTDCGVEHVQDCKEKIMRPTEYQITGGGGTDMDPAIRQAIGEGYKIIINLTDCYVPYALSKRDLKGRKVITVSTTDHRAPDHYGPTIQVKRK